MSSFAPNGAISFENAAEVLENDGLTRSIVTVYGGTRPHAISEYYNAGTGIPASGTISMSNIRASTNQGYDGLSATTNNINE